MNEEKTTMENLVLRDYVAYQLLQTLQYALHNVIAYMQEKTEWCKEYQKMYEAQENVGKSIIEFKIAVCNAVDHNTRKVVK